MHLLATAPYFIIKLSLSAVAFTWALIRPKWMTIVSYRDIPTLDGVAIKAAFTKSRNGLGFTFFRSELPGMTVIFDVNRENWWDRLFKKQALTSEPQVGNLKFDDAFYIRSDSPSFSNALRTGLEIQSAITDLFGCGARWLALEDGRLRVNFAGDQRESSAAAANFSKLNKALLAIAPRLNSGDDPFAVIMQRLRALMFAVAVYGTISFIELLTSVRGDFVRSQDLFSLGLKVAIPVLVLFCVAVVRTLSGSSRAPRFLSQFGIIIVLAGIPAIIGLMGDLDRYFDRRPVITAERVVRSLNAYEYRTKSGKGYNYEACFDPAVLAGRSGPAAEIPKCMRLTYEEYSDMRIGDGARFVIGPGLLGIPWYKRIQRLER